MERLDLVLPSELRIHLLAEGDAITKGAGLHHLPRVPCAKEVLFRYLEARTKKKAKGKERKSDPTYAAMVEGLCTYLDESLPELLLYPEERAQYECASNDGNLSSPSEVYGTEHLLRLFVRLPDLLPMERMDLESRAHLSDRLKDVLQYLVQQRGRILSLPTSKDGSERISFEGDVTLE